MYRPGLSCVITLLLNHARFVADGSALRRPPAGLSELFFPGWALLPKWLAFLDTQKTISKDAWSRLRHYVATVKLDLSNQDDDRE